MVARGRGWRIRGSDEWVNVVERYKLLVIGLIKPWGWNGDIAW